MFNKLLVPYDLSKASSMALKMATQLACEYDSEIVILHTVVFDSRTLAYGNLPSREEIQAKIHEEISTNLNLFLKEIDGESPVCRIEIRWGESAPTILEKIEEENPDLTIMGTLGRSGISHMFLGSTAEKVVRHSEKPVLVVRKPGWPFENILLPVDFCPLTNEALLLASELKKIREKTKLDLLHILTMTELNSSIPGVLPSMVDEIVESFEKSAKEKFETIQGQHQNLNLNTFLKTGNRADEIIEFAKAQKSDLIIMPTHGLTGLKHLLIGSVTEKVVRHAPCNVLTFKAKEKE